MNTQTPEEILRQMLQAKSQDATSDLTFDDIRRGAAARRHRSAWRAAGVAAAATVAIGVPTALYLRPAAESPQPTPSRSVSSSPSSSAAPSPNPTGPRLAAIPRGADPKIAYLHDGIVHQPDGSTSRLPRGATDVVDFTPYHGGWIVLDSVGNLVQYDNTGAVVQRSGSGEPALAVSADQLTTAYQLGDHIRIGISTGMGDSETSLKVPTESRLVGFVVGDGVVYDSPSVVMLSSSVGASHPISGLGGADATAAGADLVGGLAPDQKSGRVVSATTGKTLWTSAWQPRAFTPDGRYVAAVLPSETEGPDVAILDARTGAVVARPSLAERGVSGARPLAWEPDGTLLVLATGSSGQTVLRLTPAGAVERATDVVGPEAADPAWVFTTTP